MFCAVEFPKTPSAKTLKLKLETWIVVDRPVAPVRSAAIAHAFDTAAVGGEAVRMLGALGAVGLPPPDLQGYTEPKPV